MLTAKEVQRYVIALINDGDVSVSGVGGRSFGICADGAWGDVFDVGCRTEVVSDQRWVIIEK